MGLTTRYQLPYPEPPEPADVPGDMKELAERTEVVTHDLIFVPLDGRLGTVELTLTGVSNDGAGKLTLSGGLVTPKDIVAAGKLTVTGTGSMIKSLTIGQPGDTLDPAGSLTVYNNLSVFGGGAVRLITVGSQTLGFFGTNRQQYNSVAFNDFLSHLGNDNTSGAIRELSKCLKGFGLMTSP